MRPRVVRSPPAAPPPPPPPPPPPRAGPRAAADGVVTGVSVTPGTAVDKGAVLVTLGEAPAPA